MKNLEIEVGIYAWVAASVALYRSGVPWTPLLVLSPTAYFMVRGHARPYGSIVFGCSFLCALFLGVVPNGPGVPPDPRPAIRSVLEGCLLAALPQSPFTPSISADSLPPAARTGYSTCCRSTRDGGDVLEDAGTGGLRKDAPELGGYFERGSLVFVSARTGNDLQGYVCEADGRGLLIDVRDPSGDPGGYEFLPWSSIERIITEG